MKSVRHVSIIQIVNILAILLIKCENWTSASVIIRSTTDSTYEDPSNAICLTEHCIHTASRILSSIDDNVDPCDDFYAFACNGWIRNNPIPDNSETWSVLEKLMQTNEIVVKKMLDRPLAEFKSDAEQKAKSFYESCLDADGTIEKLGAEPLHELLRQIGGWNVTDSGFIASNFNALATMKLLQNRFNVGGFFTWHIGVDYRNSSRRVISLHRDGMSLPRQHYLNRTKYADNLDAYANSFIEVAVLLGADATTVRSQFERVLVLETRLAELPISGKAIKSVSDLQRLSPFIDWMDYFNDALIHEDVQISDADEVVIYAPEYYEQLSIIVRAYNRTENGRKTLSNFLVWKLVQNYLPYLSKSFRKALEASMNEGDNTCVTQTSNIFGSAIGAMFVREVSHVEAIRIMKKMIDEVRQAFKQNLENLRWLDAETRTLVEDKADAMSDFVGFPDYILQPDKLDEKYRELVAEPNQYFDNNLRSNEYIRKLNLKQFGQPVDRKQWAMQLPLFWANAQYSPTVNSIEILAGIMRSPLFDSRHAKSLNFGAIGTVMGHELTHGFDNQGGQFDKFGNRREWWTSTSVNNFKERAAYITDEYGSFVINGKALNGDLTLGENMADNGGLNAAFRAFIVSKNESDVDTLLLPGLDMTHRQLFFVSFAQTWCTAGTDEAISTMDPTGKHSPPRLRVIGTLSNSADFSREYGCPLGSPMNPVDKCEVW